MQATATLRQLNANLNIISYFINKSMASEILETWPQSAQLVSISEIILIFLWEPLRGCRERVSKAKPAWPDRSGFGRSEKWEIISRNAPRGSRGQVLKMEREDYQHCFLITDWYNTWILIPSVHRLIPWIALKPLWIQILQLTSFTFTLILITLCSMGCPR